MLEKITSAPKSHSYTHAPLPNCPRKILPSPSTVPSPLPNTGPSPLCTRSVCSLVTAPVLPRPLFLPLSWKGQEVEPIFIFFCFPITPLSDLSWHPTHMASDNFLKQRDSRPLHLTHRLASLKELLKYELLLSQYMRPDSI